MRGPSHSLLNTELRGVGPPAAPAGVPYIKAFSGEHNWNNARVDDPGFESAISAGLLVSRDKEPTVK
jgi:hypothetical protein